MTSGLSRARQRSGQQSTADHSRGYSVRGLVYLYMYRRTYHHVSKVTDWTDIILPRGT